MNFEGEGVGGQWVGGGRTKRRRSAQRRREQSDPVDEKYYWSRERRHCVIFILLFLFYLFFFPGGIQQIMGLNHIRFWKKSFLKIREMFLSKSRAIPALAWNCMNMQFPPSVLQEKKKRSIWKRKKQYNQNRKSLFSCLLNGRPLCGYLWKRCSRLAKSTFLASLQIASHNSIIAKQCFLIFPFGSVGKTIHILDLSLYTDSFPVETVLC